MGRIAESIVNFLISSGYSHVYPYRFRPSSKDNIIVIVGGGYSQPVFTGAGDIDYPAVQIQVRDEDMETAETRAYAVLALLKNQDGIDGVTLMQWDGRAPDHAIEDGTGLHKFRFDFHAIISN